MHAVLCKYTSVGYGVMCVCVCFVSVTTDEAMDNYLQLVNVEGRAIQTLSVSLSSFTFYLYLSEKIITLDS